jgi:hypothetical protein
LTLEPSNTARPDGFPSRSVEVPSAFSLPRPMRILPPDPAQAYLPVRKSAAAAGTAAQTSAPISSQDPSRNAETLFAISSARRNNKPSRALIDP